MPHSHRVPLVRPSPDLRLLCSAPPPHRTSAAVTTSVTAQWDPAASYASRRPDLPRSYSVQRARVPRPPRPPSPHSFQRPGFTSSPSPSRRQKLSATASHMLRRTSANKPRAEMHVATPVTISFLLFFNLGKSFAETRR